MKSGVKSLASLVLILHLFGCFCRGDEINREFLKAENSTTFNGDRHLVVVGEPPGPGAGVHSVADGSYQPQTEILDQQRIGLDQQEIIEKLNNFTFEEALAIYQVGGHSGSFATISLNVPLSASIQERSIVLGTSETGEQVRAVIENEVPALAISMDVVYPVSAEGPHCFVGGKTDPVTNGCFSSSNTLLVVGQEVSGFSYDALQNTRNARTIQGMAVDSLFRECGRCPLETHLKYINYYGYFTYADDMILSAFRQSATNLNTNNADFSQMSPLGRSEVIQRLTLNLVVWMYAVNMMEYGLEKCHEQNPLDTGVAEWDSAVAFYIGTTTNTTGLLYDLAKELCSIFTTCDETGTALVNREIMEEFTSGQSTLAKGQCDEATEKKDRILSLMTIPLIQGTLLYSHLLRGTQDEKILGATYSFVAAVLPLLYACGSEGVRVVASSVSIPSTDAASAAEFFPLVKGFIEDQYECLGITCKDVGILDGAELCAEHGPDDILDDDIPTDDLASALGVQSILWLTNALCCSVLVTLLGL